MWCSLVPVHAIRVWSIYVDEDFLPTQLEWALPDKSRVIPGVHPLDWTDAPLVLQPGIDNLRRIEPIWRQMSVLGSSRLLPEKVAARAVALFAWSIKLSVETLVLPGPAVVEARHPSPVLGNLNSSAVSQGDGAAVKDGGGMDGGSAHPRGRVVAIPAQPSSAYGGRRC